MHHDEIEALVGDFIDLNGSHEEQLKCCAFREKNTKFIWISSTHIKLLTECRIVDHNIFLFGLVCQQHHLPLLDHSPTHHVYWQ